MQQQAHGISDIQYSGVLPPFIHQKRYTLFMILQGFSTYNLYMWSKLLEQEFLVCWNSQCIFNLCIKKDKITKNIKPRVSPAKLSHNLGPFG